MEAMKNLLVCAATFVLTSLLREYQVILGSAVGSATGPSAGSSALNGAPTGPGDISMSIYTCDAFVSPDEASYGPFAGKSPHKEICLMHSLGRGSSEGSALAKIHQRKRQNGNRIGIPESQSSPSFQPEEEGEAVRRATSEYLCGHVRDRVPGPSAVLQETMRLQGGYNENESPREAMEEKAQEMLAEFLGESAIRSGDEEDVSLFTSFIAPKLLRVGSRGQLYNAYVRSLITYLPQEYVEKFFAALSSAAYNEGRFYSRMLELSGKFCARNSASSECLNTNVQLLPRIGMAYFAGRLLMDVQHQEMLRKLIEENTAETRDLIRSQGSLLFGLQKLRRQRMQGFAEDIVEFVRINLPLDIAVPNSSGPVESPNVQKCATYVPRRTKNDEGPDSEPAAESGPIGPSDLDKIPGVLNKLVYLRSHREEDEADEEEAAQRDAQEPSKTAEDVLREIGEQMVMDGLLLKVLLRDAEDIQDLGTLIRPENMTEECKAAILGALEDCRRLYRKKANAKMFIARDYNEILVEVLRGKDDPDTVSTDTDTSAIPDTSTIPGGSAIPGSNLGITTDANPGSNP